MIAACRVRHDPCPVIAQTTQAEPTGADAAACIRWGSEENSDSKITPKSVVARRVHSHFTASPNCGICAAETNWADQNYWTALHN